MQLAILSEKPLFSVLIANYNNGRFLKNCIDSIVAQTYSSWEIIFVDDASTDDSLKILESYKHLPIKVITNPKNEGCGFSKHKAAEEANGELLGYVDPDDTLTPDALEVMVNAFHTHPNAGLIYSRYYHCDIHLNILSTSSHQLQIPPQSSFLEIGKACISQFAVFRSSVFCATGGIHPMFRRAVDHDLYLKLEEIAPTIFIDKALYNYRDNPKGISKEQRNKAALWSNIARIHALQRRGKDPEEAFEIWSKREKNIIRHVKNSPEFKIGSFLLFLPRTLKKLFSTNL
jgi:glycosyltransferase involved in cell wall biosynthesis